MHRQTPLSIYLFRVAFCRLTKGIPIQAICLLIPIKLSVICLLSLLLPLWFLTLTLWGRLLLCCLPEDSKNANIVKSIACGAVHAAFWSLHIDA